jgi:Protein of unknown function (DUF1570)
MHLALSLALAFVASGASTPSNLAFETGRLTNWEGNGFYLTPADGRGPTRTFAVCSSDCGKAGRSALLHRTFTVPAGAGVLRFMAAAFRPANCQPTTELDAYLEAADRVYLPRQVHTPSGWSASAELLPPTAEGRLREYRWDISRYAGQRIRVAIVDRDERPGCFLVCGGFRILPREDTAAKEFTAAMLKLTREHNLGTMDRYDSKHFMAITNAADDYTEERLSNCETIYSLFFEHFRDKGFALREPATKLMVAVFDTQEGFEAYLGTRMPTAVTGIYHRGTNRLVVYDFASNRGLKAIKRAGQQEANRIDSGLIRQRVLGSVNRMARENRQDANIGTIMHEVAHQLSFNCGLLNREGDVACWLAEGLATYCESTANGAWQGIGEPNPLRTAGLVAPARGQAPFLSLPELVAGDGWIRQAKSTEAALQGYAQSWALFRMLMEERPQAFRKYLSLIYPRRTPDHRLTDFVQCFGDVSALEARYHAYIRQVVNDGTRPASR